MSEPDHIRQQWLSRHPSAGWEVLPLPSEPGFAVWAWFKPPQAPQDVMLRIPPETMARWGGQVSLRQLLDALNVPFSLVQFWYAGGMWLDPQQGHNPLLDHPLPWQGPHDPGIVLRLAFPQLPPMFAAAPPVFAQPTTDFGPSSIPANASDNALLDAMDSDWNAIQTLETQLDAARKQLGSIQGRLQSLNRDLSVDERQACDSNDIKDWADARRFVRDNASQVSRYIRDYTIGVSSGAGQRPRFEQLYKDHVATRKPFPGLGEAARDMEMYRKVVQGLVQKMQSVANNAGREGEQRAMQVLSRIGAKMRKARGK